MGSIYSQDSKPAISTSQKKVGVRNRQKMRSSRLFSLMVQSYQEGIADFWQNPDGLSPQEAFDAIGTDGAETVRRCGLLAEVINNAQPGTIPASTVVVATANAQGVVTWPEGATPSAVALIMKADGTVQVTNVPTPGQ